MECSVDGGVLVLNGRRVGGSDGGIVVVRGGRFGSDRDVLALDCGRVGGSDGRVGGICFIVADVTVYPHSIVRIIVGVTG